MSYRGDIALGSTIDMKFTTVGTTGAPTTLAGTPVVSAYVDNGLTQITAGITLTVDFDAVTGLHNVRVVATAGNGFAVGTNVDLVITTGTVGGTSVVGYVIGSCSIEARSSLRPTTAGRTLDVSATGEAGVDWANVGSPTTVLGLSGTTVKTATDVETDTVDIQARLPAALTTNGNMKSSLMEILTTALTETVGLLAGGFKKFFNVATPTGTVNSLADAVPGAAGGGFIAGTNAATAITTALTANVTGNLSGSVGSVTGAVGSVTGAVASVTADVGITQAGADKVWSSATRTLTAFSTALALSVWDVLTANILTASSIGIKLTNWALGTDNRALVSADVHTSGETVAAVTGAVGSVTGAIGSLGATAKSDVNAEVVDALNVDTYAEIGQEAPAATQTIRKMIAYPYKAWRNRVTQTATTYSLYNDDATTVAQKSTVSDAATTFDKGEVGTGP